MTECASASDLNIILFCFILDYLLFYILYSKIINNSLELWVTAREVYTHIRFSLWWSKIYILPLIHTIPLHSLLVASVKQLFSFREGLHKLRYWDICFWTTTTLVLDRAHRIFFYHPLRFGPCRWDTLILYSPCRWDILTFSSPCRWDILDRRKSHCLQAHLVA